MNILDTIIARKKEEVAFNKIHKPMVFLEQLPAFARTTFSLEKSLQDVNKTGIIAEFKRKSPSKGFINKDANVIDITTAYCQNDAAGISVLTDVDFFGGTNDDLIAARKNDIPILRKDFIIDEYQIIEAKAIGADVILLIAACLTLVRVKELARFARSLNLDVLLELHSEDELNHICADTNIIGINNRNLKTFDVSIERSLKMGEQIGSSFVKVAESGIDDIENIKIFKQNGFKGFLIGEYFMRQSNTVSFFEQFTKAVKAL